MFKVLVYANDVHECTSKCMCMFVVTDNIHKQKCSKFPFPLYSYSHIFSVHWNIHTVCMHMWCAKLPASVISTGVWELGMKIPFLL